MRFLTAGESHGQRLVAMLDGIPAGVPIEVAAIDRDLRRRQLGYGRGARQKIERDQVRIVGGVRHGRTTGGPLALEIDNRDAPNWERVMSVEPVVDPPAPVTRLRPGHADLAGALKFGHGDVRDVIERSSARETAARVAAGGVAKAVLALVGMRIHSEVVAIGRVESAPTWDEATVEASEVRCGDAERAAEMILAISEARDAGDTLGGIVALRATGVVPGLGSYAEWDRRLDGRIAQALCSIQAAKGMEFGDAFAAARERGSAVHDPIVMEGGRFARTRYAVEARGPAATLVRAELETGRTHQVRVHLAALGHPLAGDRLYGGARAAALAARPMLHACRLRLRHPRTGQEMTFETPPPGDFTSTWDRLH